MNRKPTEDRLVSVKRMQENSIRLLANLESDCRALNRPIRKLLREKKELKRQIVVLECIRDWKASDA